MAHPKDDELLEVGTVVRLKETGEFGIILQQVFLMDGRNFLHYEGRIYGRENSRGMWAMYHERIEPTSLSPDYFLKDN